MSAFAQTSAATAAASRTAALPVSVRRKLRSGVSRFRTHAVRPENGDSRAGAPAAAPLLLIASPPRLFERLQLGFSHAAKAGCGECAGVDEPAEPAEARDGIGLVGPGADRRKDASVGEVPLLDL